MLTYEELMEKRRRRRARALVKYSIMDGVPRREAERIAKLYLQGKITYGTALRQIDKLVEELKKQKKKQKTRTHKRTKRK